MKIKLAEEIGEQLASIDDGKKLFDLLMPVMKNKQTAVLDLSGVSALLTPFLHGGIGPLFDFYDKGMIMERLSIANASAEQLKKINEYIDNTDRRDTQSSHREIMEDLFDEDDLGDLGL